MKVRSLCALLLCFLCLSACSSTVSGMPEVSTPPPAPTQRAPLPTQPKRNAPLAPTATTAPTEAPAISTPTASIQSRPALGDPVSAWTAYYGSYMDLSTTQGKMYEYIDDTGPSIDSIIAGFDTTQSNRVFTITLEPMPQNRPWSPLSLSKIDTLYLPATAVQRQVIPPSANGYGTVWYSSVLAQEFPPSYFIDNNGNLVEPGLCVVYRVYDAHQNIARVTITLGLTYGL